MIAVSIAQKALGEWLGVKCGENFRKRKDFRQNYVPALSITANGDLGGAKTEVNGDGDVLATSAHKDASTGCIWSHKHYLLAVQHSNTA
jgi:hypothetical protein